MNLLWAKYLLAGLILIFIITRTILSAVSVILKANLGYSARNRGEKTAKSRKWEE